MNNRYELLKDLIDVKAGAIAEWDESTNAYKMEKDAWISPYRHHWLTRGQVEQSPEWFRKIEDRIEVENVRFISDGLNGGAIWAFDTNRQFHPEKLTKIKKAIEEVLNGPGEDDCYENVSVEELKHIIHYWRRNNQENRDLLKEAQYKLRNKKFTQQDIDKAMEDAFNAARAYCYTAIDGTHLCFPTYQDYINSINKSK